MGSERVRVAGRAARMGNIVYLAYEGGEFNRESRRTGTNTRHGFGEGSVLIVATVWLEHGQAD